MLSLDLAGIFAAGLLTFASPCVLPLVPLYLGLLGGASAAERRGGPPARLVLRTVACALGLGTVFVALGLAASAAGQVLSAHRRELLAVSGAVVIAFGLRFLGVLRLPFADRERRPWLHRLTPGGSLLAAYAFGAAFALGWTPCIGPVLGSVLTYTASAGASPARGALDLAVYAAGLTLPLVVSAAFAPVVLGWLARLRPHLRKLEVATGLLLVGVGVLLVTDHLMLLAPAVGRGAPAVAAARGAPASSPADAAGQACSASPEAGGTCAVAAPTGPAGAPASLAHGPAVVEVMSRHCPICRLMAPVVAEAEQGCPAKVVRTFVEDPAGAALARSHAVRGVPTFLVLAADGTEVGRLVGQQTAAAVRSALERVSPELCRAPAPAPAEAAKGS